MTDFVLFKNPFLEKVVLTAAGDFLLSASNREEKNALLALNMTLFVMFKETTNKSLRHKAARLLCEHVIGRFICSQK